MKKTILLGISALVATGLLCGCSEEWGVNRAGAGRIAPQVGIDTQAVTSRSDVASRADGDISAADLSLTLTKADGSYKQTWATVAEFPVDKEFAVGDYTLDAFYGDPAEQGFEKPAYAGSQTLKVSDGLTTTLGLTASLANSMFTIKYTDAFAGYMADWSASVNGVEYAKDETRPVYVKPGDVTIKISVTKPNGLKADFTLDKVTAEPKYHYTVTVDVNDGNVGGSSLNISFDDNLAQEEVEIDLSDKLLSAPAPVVVADGFTAGTPVSFVSGLSSAQHLAMSVIAQAGLAEVLLETSSVSLLAQGWPASIDLLKASASEQATLTGLGLSAIGLWKSPDQMAVLDFSDVVKSIRTVDTDNTSTFTLTVKDKLSRAGEPMVLSLTVEEISLELTSTSENFAPGDELQLQLGFNGGNVAENVKIEYYHPVSAMWRPLAIKAVSEGVSRAMADYTLTVVAPDIDGDLRLRAKCGDKVSATLSVQCAPFEVAGNDNDIYATHAFVTVIGTEGNANPSLDAAEFFIQRPGEEAFSAATVVRSGDYFDVKGLTPGAENLIKVRIDGLNSKPKSIFTEEALAVPNGDFENLSQTMSKTDMPESGEWSISRGINYQNTLSYTVSEPVGWASVNDKTASSASANQNSWFVVPSTFNTSGSYVGQYPTVMTYTRNEGTPDSYKDFGAQSGTNAMVVRNVAWDANGTTPSLWYKMFASDHWNHNVPTIANRSAGKLFLGTYSFNGGTEAYNEGVAFASRPSSLNGYYRYALSSQDAAEKAVVTVSLLNGNTVLATGTAKLEPAGDFVQFSIPLNYESHSAKATALRIMIASSDKASYNQSEETSAIKTDNKLNVFEAYSVGATLVIDNLTFNY